MLEQKFNAISKELVELYAQIGQTGFKATKEVFDRAFNVYGRVGEFIETLEEMDENMDLEKTKLPNIDELFEGPVNDYVQASIQYAVNGTLEAEKLRFEAAMNLKAFQDGYESEEFDECACNGECCIVCDEEYESLLDVIRAEDCEHHANVAMFCQLIEEALDSLKTTDFDEEDYELIRYYLKTLPDHSDFEVDSMEDGTLAAAWRKHKYFREIR